MSTEKNSKESEIRRRKLHHICEDMVFQDTRAKCFLLSVSEWDDYDRCGKIRKLFPYNLDDRIDSENRHESNYLLLCRDKPLMYLRDASGKLGRIMHHELSTYTPKCGADGSMIMSWCYEMPITTFNTYEDFVGIKNHVLPMVAFYVSAGSPLVKKMQPVGDGAYSLTLDVNSAGRPTGNLFSDKITFLCQKTMLDGGGIYLCLLKDIELWQRCMGMVFRSLDTEVCVRGSCALNRRLDEINIVDVVVNSQSQKEDFECACIKGDGYWELMLELENILAANSMHISSDDIFDRYWYQSCTLHMFARSIEGLLSDYASKMLTVTMESLQSVHIATDADYSPKSDSDGLHGMMSRQFILSSADINGMTGHQQELLRGYIRWVLSDRIAGDMCSKLVRLQNRENDLLYEGYYLQSNNEDLSTITYLDNREVGRMIPTSSGVPMTYTGDRYNNEHVLYGYLIPKSHDICRFIRYDMLLLHDEEKGSLFVFMAADWYADAGVRLMVYLGEIQFSYAVLRRLMNIKNGEDFPSACKPLRSSRGGWLSLSTYQGAEYDSLNPKKEMLWHQWMLPLRMNYTSHTTWADCSLELEILTKNINTSVTRSMDGKPWRYAIPYCEEDLPDFIDKNAAEPAFTAVAESGRIMEVVLQKWAESDGKLAV